ncbi:MAG TPA: hypothetical protein VGR35_23730 [Tepidisphaeraceae bacterium]|nr:hypothetical protein [Tepidisphaeraceae bacterium]
MTLQAEEQELNRGKTGPPSPAVESTDRVVVHGPANEFPPLPPAVEAKRPERVDQRDQLGVERLGDDATGATLTGLTHRFDGGPQLRR